MRIVSVLVEEMGPIEEHFSEYKHCNVVIGTNGTGKTFLLELIAGVLGNDDATHLLHNRSAKKIEIVFEDGKANEVFKSSGEFDLDEIANFKKSLSSRVSFPITQEWGSFSHDDRPAKINTRMARHYFGESIERELWCSPNRARFMGGDGFRRQMEIIMSMPSARTPLIIEFPERHLDLIAQKKICDIISFSGQSIISTHSPSVLGGFRKQSANIIDMTKIIKENA